MGDTLKKSLISKEPLDLIDKQQEHRNKLEYREEWDLTREVKKQASKDEKNLLKQQLEEHSKGHPAEQWEGVTFSQGTNWFQKHSAQIQRQDSTIFRKGRRTNQAPGTGTVGNI